MVDGDGAAMEQVQAVIAASAAQCAKAQGWTDAQQQAAADWGGWQVMDAELERRSGLPATDLAVLRRFVDEDASRVGDLDHYDSAQLDALAAELRRRGAHVHEGGAARKQDLGILMVRKAMKDAETAFAAR